MIASRSSGDWLNMSLDSSSGETKRQQPAAEKPLFVTLCGRIFRNTDPTYFPQFQYHGRTIYLCTQSCLHAMEADAERFYYHHRKRAES